MRVLLATAFLLWATFPEAPLPVLIDESGERAGLRASVGGVASGLRWMLAHHECPDGAAILGQDRARTVPFSTQKRHVRSRPGDGRAPGLD